MLPLCTSQASRINMSTRHGWPATAARGSVHLQLAPLWLALGSFPRKSRRVGGAQSSNSPKGIPQLCVQLVIEQLCFETHCSTRTAQPRLSVTYRWLPTSDKVVNSLQKPNSTINLCLCTKEQVVNPDATSSAPPCSLLWRSLEHLKRNTPTVEPKWTENDERSDFGCLEPYLLLAQGPLNRDGYLLEIPGIEACPAGGSCQCSGTRNGHPPPACSRRTRRRTASKRTFDSFLGAL